LISYQELLGKLEGTKPSGERKAVARCPAHDDRNASLSISRGKNGGVVLHCHAGCTTEAVVESLGLKVADLMPEKAAEPRIVATYDYHDAEGALVYQVVRMEPKTFRQRKPDGAGGWLWKLGETPRVPFKLRELAQSTGTVYIVEGEKDALALWALGVPATCNPGGAGKWKHLSASAVRHGLKGRDVVIIPDRDAPGRAHAEDVAVRLAKIAASARVVELPEGSWKDVSDWLAAGGTAEQLRALSVAPPPEKPPEPPADVLPFTIRKNSHRSVVEIVRTNRADVVGGQIRYNEMANSLEIWRDGKHLRTIEDYVLNQLRERCEARIPVGRDRDGIPIGLCPSLDAMFAAVGQVARDNHYHPVKEYLESLAWDGIKRIGSMVSEAMQCSGLLAETLVRKTMIAAVARVYKPGCQVDTVLVLVSETQGQGKSRWFKALFGDRWVVDTRIDIDHKDAYGQIGRAWAVEFAEMLAVRRAKDMEGVKAFITGGPDTYRRAYDRLEVQIDRRCVFVGSTNNRRFLSDPSGARRFWPLEIGGPIDREWVREHRDQLWAEARAAFLAGEAWHLDDLEEETLVAEQRDYTEEDLWEGPILEWAASRTGFTTREALQRSGHGLPEAAMDRTAENRCAAILRKAGYVQRRSGSGPRTWRKPGSVAAQPTSADAPIAPTPENGWSTQ
jgi:predicted P-loop ATPase